MDGACVDRWRQHGIASRVRGVLGELGQKPPAAFGALVAARRVLVVGAVDGPRLVLGRRQGAASAAAARRGRRRPRRRGGRHRRRRAALLLLELGQQRFGGGGGDSDRARRRAGRVRAGALAARALQAPGAHGSCAPRRQHDEGTGLLVDCDVLGREARLAVNGRGAAPADQDGRVRLERVRRGEVAGGAAPAARRAGPASRAPSRPTPSPRAAARPPAPARP